MADNLRDPLLFPNWVWLLSVALLLIAVGVAAGLLVAYRFALVKTKVVLHPLNELRRERYLKQVAQVQLAAQSGDLDARQVHLALSSIIRACASERLKRNVESVTVKDAGQLEDAWPVFVDALAWCERPSFGVDEPSDPLVEIGMAKARAVIGS